MSGIIILGAGGHAKVVADTIQLLGWTVTGFLDDNPDMIGSQVYGLSVLGQINRWHEWKPTGLVIGIGNNAVRQRIVEQLEPMQPNWMTIIHPHSFVSPSVFIGPGSVIMANVAINAGAVIGHHTIINTGATVDHECEISDYVHIAPGVHLAGNVTIRRGAFLGIGCSVIPGCVIGENTVVGAQSAIISDIPAGVTAKGVPARWQ